MTTLGTEIIKQFGIKNCAKCNGDLIEIGWQSVSIPGENELPRALCFWCDLAAEPTDEPYRIPPAL